jgi:hypothetical protein
MKRALLVVPLMFAALLVLPTAPAWACSCASSTVTESVERADVVLLGRLSKSDGPSRVGLSPSSDDPWQYTFAVNEVYKGRAAGTTHVVSPASSASCGLEGLLPGRDYIVFAQAQGRELRASLCGGSDLAGSGLVADVEAVTGSGHPPVRAEVVDPAAPLPGAVAPAREGAWLVPLVGGLALALVLAGLLLAVVRRGRRRG